MSLYEEIKTNKNAIERNLFDNIGKILLTILFLSPLFIFYELKSLFGEKISGYALILNHFTYGLLLFLTLPDALKSYGITPVRFNSIKNYLFFSIRTLLLLITFRVSMSAFAFILIVITSPIPFLSIIFNEAVMAFLITMAGVFFVYKVCNVLPDFFLGKDINLLRNYKETNSIEIKMILSGLWVGIPYIIFMIIINNSIIFIEGYFTNNNSENTSIILSTIITLPLTVIIQPLTAVICSYTIAHFYKPADN